MKRGFRFVDKRAGGHILFADFKNDYKTLYPWYMESIWWVFSELWNKGLVYRGVKVMPYSTACNTPLSNFESSQNYKEVVDPAGRFAIAFRAQFFPRPNLFTHRLLLIFQ